jgi:predicted dehydrogenase
LDSIERFFAQTTKTPILMTGFNRRFSPALAAARAALSSRSSPLLANYRLNAGYLPPGHWVHGPEGGGRNIGEACHVYDVFGFLTGSRPVAVQAEAISPRGRELRRNDNFVATIRYDDGSVCSLTYTALGTPGYPKERMEIFADGKVISLDDYRTLEVRGADAQGWSSSVADKGYVAELAAFAAAVRGWDWPISLADQVAATRVSLEIEDRIRAGPADRERD